MERIMADLYFTADQKLKGAVSLLRDEAYQWWLIVKEGTQPDRLTWDLFKTAFPGKYVGANYIDARRREFLNLAQRDRSVAKYEAEFLRLSHYVLGMVAYEYERCILFEDGLRNNLMVLIASQRDREFAVLVKKAKITKDVKRTERHKRGKNKRDLEPSSSGMRPKKKARSDGPVRVGPPVAPTRVALCGQCGRCHPGECWRTTRACLRCRSTEHHVWDCPLRIDQVQALSSGTVQPPRVV
ncbi:uncharacterized protein LOC108468800 [Gossypium arboreum]|uniref:uncharacterized protein LOC108468800 n=1 Tax=Gossypium arboreum TaxID=29729 RepID=UPI00081942C6|nr:uncharacterized protein LOC108468800 [Gossypium arboreum]